ncbi:MAG: hypothetical protein HY847_13050 [Betaproteobacteria bacterium]|nr:hypothetical protein [Betaproteobacteria bacterium]
MTPFEFTGLRGFSRRSGGMMGSAPGGREREAMNYATETAKKLRMIEAYKRDDAMAIIGAAADLIEKLEHCAQWVDESLTRAVSHYASECECEPCPECGKMPHECTGTECAQTCQCSDCDHCNFEGIIGFIGETLKGPNLNSPTPDVG